MTERSSGARVAAALAREVFSLSGRCARLETRLLGAPDFAPWDGAAIKRSYFDLVRARYFKGRPSPAALWACRLLPRGRDGGWGSKLLAALEFASAGHRALEDYVGLDGEREKLSSRGNFLMLSSLTSCGIAGNLLAICCAGQSALRRLAVLTAFTDCTNSHLIGLAQHVAYKGDFFGRLSGREYSIYLKHSSPANCLKLCIRVLAAMRALRPAAAAALEREALLLVSARDLREELEAFARLLRGDETRFFSRKRRISGLLPRRELEAFKRAHASGRVASFLRGGGERRIAAVLEAQSNRLLRREPARFRVW